MFKVFITTCLAVLISCFILFNCQLPQPPAGPEEVRIDVVLQTSDEKTTGIVITDTVGNQIQIRSIFTLTHYIDSAKIEIFSESTLEKTIQCRYKIAQVDTVFIPYTFKTPGSRTIKLTAYIKGYNDIVSNVTIHVLDRPTNNKKPVLVVPGNQTIRTGQLLTFTVTATDSNSDQQVTISTLKKPAGSTFMKGTFSWTPELADIGTETIIFIATDNGYPALSDTASVFVTVSHNFAPDSVPPVITFLSPSKDTVISVDSFEVKVSCVDASGCFVKGFRDSTMFTLKKSGSVANLWTGMAKGIAAGSYSTIKIIATDSSAAENKDSAAVRIKCDNDKSGPAITLLIPAKDSVTTNSSSYTIVLKVTDPSGIFSVNGISGTTNYPGVRDTGSVWKINVTNLENHKVTPIILTATDSSLKANKTYDTVYIRSAIINGYKIKFDKNDSAATGTMADQTINSGDSAKLAANTFIKEGSQFAGWMTSPTGSTIAFADGAMYKMGTTDVTLYARWIKKVRFALSITATNGSVIKSPNAAVYDSGSTVGLKATANTGYKFVNWSGDVTGTADSTAIVVNKVTSITANFSPIPYTVTFSSRGTTYSTVTVNYNVLATEPAAPQGGTCDTLDGWYTSETYATKWDFLADKVTNDTTLFAKWSQRTYLITYNSNGALSGTPPAQQTKICDSALTLASNSGNLAKTGVTFSGWNTTTEGTGTDYAQGASYTANAPLALFAKWKTDSLIVTFNSNGGSAVTSKMVVYDGYVTEPAVPTRDGFAFAGWYSNQSLTTPFDFATAITVARTLYAKWDQLFKVNYNSNGGSGSAPVDNNSYKSGQFITVLEKPTGLTRQYYDFAGWNTKSDGTGATRLAGTTFQIGAKNDTLYAVWQIAKPVITSQPTLLTVYPLDSISFSITAAGIELSYQWQKDGTNISGANNAHFSKQRAVYADSGYYSCNISNVGGTTSSNSVKLTVRTTVKDADSNEYSIVVIGNQVWTTTNLRTTKYNDGAPIPFDTATDTWYFASTPKYCFYNNTTDPEDIKKYGALYNWHAVATNKLAPIGWHVPTEDDWTTLESYLITNGYNWDGSTSSNKIAKAVAAKTDWRTSEYEGSVGNTLSNNNTTGLSLLAGGYRYYTGSFDYLGSNGYFWSATSVDLSDATNFKIFYDASSSYKSPSTKSNGFSVRLVRN